MNTPHDLPTRDLPVHDFDVVIIGGGQSGLALGYQLASRGRRFTILDAGERIGHVWRSRWDSLRLITPCPYNDLPGLAFPAPRGSFPHKDQVADYLERYVRMYALPVRLGHRVHALRRAGERYRVETARAVFEAPVVVAATGPFQHPSIPDFAADADASVLQLHSREYRNPGQLPAGDVLVVGCGNSGAGIAQELVAARRVQRRVHLALGRTAASRRRMLGRDLFWWAHHLGLPRATIDTRLGRRISRQPDGLIGITPAQLAAQGVTLAPRVTAMDGAAVRFADGTRRRFDAVIWATGYRPRYDWITLAEPVLDEHGAPVHRRGVSPAPGLCFLGLKWLYRFDSSLIGGVGRDAAYLSTHIDSYLASLETA